MNLTDIRPYVRFARYLTIDPTSNYPSGVPLDARLFFVCGGCGEIEVLNNTYKTEKRSCLFIPAGTEYRLLTPKKTVTYLAVNFDLHRTEGSPIVPVRLASPAEFKPKMLISDTHLSDIDAFSEPLFIPSINIENELTQIEAEYSHKYEHSDAIMQNLMHNILIDCIRHRDIQSGNAVKLDIKKILDYIYENCHKDLSNAKVADVFGFNPNYISDVIKKYTGFSLHRYLLHIRIIKSLPLLEARNYNIAEIANICGFKETGYFSRYFKKEMGVSPMQYMNKEL